MRAVRWILIGVGAVVVLLGGAVFVITSVIDPNRYRGRVEKVVTDLVGRPFVIEEKMEVMWYPWLGVRVGRAHLEDSVGVSGPPMIEWESAVVAAKVVPLLRGQLVIDRIRLQSPHVRLRRDARGRANWEDLGRTSLRPGSTADSVQLVPMGTAGPARPEASARIVAPGARTAGASASTRAPGATTEGAVTSTEATQIAGLEVHDGVLDYVDEASGLKINLSQLDFEMSEWRIGQSLSVHSRFLVHGESPPIKGLWVGIDTPALDVRTGPLGASAQKVGIRIADAAINGSFSYEQTEDGLVSARGSIAAHAPSLRKLATDLAVNQTMPHDPNTLGPIELKTQWSYANGAIAAKPLVVKLDGVNFEGWVERGAPPRPGWRFELRGDRINLDRYVNVDSTSTKPFELDMLRDIDANGSLVFDEALLEDARLSGVRLRVETKQ